MPGDHPRTPIERVDGWTRWIAFAGFIGLIVVAVATMVDVLLRWLFNAPILGFSDITHLAFAIIVICSFPAGLVQGHNVTIRFLGKALKRRAEYWLEVFGALVTLVFFGLVGWQFIVLTAELREVGDTTMTIQVTTWPWWAFATVIIILCIPVQAFVLAGHTRRALRGHGPGGSVETGHDPMAVAEEIRNTEA